MYTSTSYCEAGQLPLEELLDLQEHTADWLKKTLPRPGKKAR